MEWLPIESAPKDGTVIVAFWIPQNGPIHSGCYATTMWCGSYWGNTDDDDDMFRLPTYWMPLPPPPVGP